MGYFVGFPLGGAAEKDCQVRFGKNMTFQVETLKHNGRIMIQSRSTLFEQ